MKEDSIIEIKNLEYNDLFKNLNINIIKNQFVTISGPNNCGKTTLLRILDKKIFLKQKITISGKNITDYKIDEYVNILQSIIPKEIIFLEEDLEREMYFHLEGRDKEKTEYINFLINGLKIKKLFNKKTSSYESKEVILAQIAIALCYRPKILVIDDITLFFSKKELLNIFDFLKTYHTKYGLTLLFTTINLNFSLFTDYLYIINDGQVAIEGEPLSVLEKDNIINKIGLELPFMIDLSVKLRDYDLINNIETDLDRMVEKLWN